MLNRFLGCLLGGALGDALGYPIEFNHSATDIQRRYGAEPPFALDYATPGRALISDDTQMTLFTAEGIIRSKQRHRERGLCHIPSVVHFSLLRWYETQMLQEPAASASDYCFWRTGWLRQQQCLYARRAPGNTCMSSLAEAQASQRFGAKAANNSKGCGAIMRSAPFGLASGSREQAFSAALECAWLTHGHPSGYLSAAYFASLIWDVRRGMALLPAMDQADQLLRMPYKNEKHHGNAHDADELLRVLDHTRSVAAQGLPNSRDVEQLGGGWTGEEALAIALLCALTVEDVSPQAVGRALWRSVVHGGDSDSTGSIAGNLLGALFGLEALSKQWVQQVELHAIIERIGEDLYRSSVLGAELAYECYPGN